jgi:hypothetical protein
LLACAVSIAVLGAGCDASPKTASNKPSGRCEPRVVNNPSQLPANSGQSDAMAFAQQLHARLGAAAQAKLDRQLQQARSAARRYANLPAARRDGYVKSSDTQPGVGAHWTSWKTVLRCGFDPARPSELLFRGTGDRARLVALSYFVVSHGPPDGFEGPNDEWHQHLGLCLRNAENLGLVTRVGFTVAQCHARGGVVFDGRDLWMLHAWVVPGFTNPWGVFASANPHLM